MKASSSPSPFRCRGPSVGRTEPAGELRDSGVYIDLFELPQTTLVKVGALGEAHLERGLYAYVGSAKVALQKRLQRHRRKRKPKRWHIDYLARFARPVTALTWEWREGRECKLAEALMHRGLGERVVKGFGASDCGCGGHLVRLKVGAEEVRGMAVDGASGE